MHLLEEVSLNDLLNILSDLQGGAPLPATAVRPDLPRAISSPAASSHVSVTTPTAVTLGTPPAIEIPVPTVTPPTNNLQPSTTISDTDPWHRIAMELASDSPLKFGWIEDSKFVERTGNTIVVEFPPSVESKTSTLFWPQAIKKIEELLTASLGAPITLESRFNGVEPALPPEPPPLPVVTAAIKPPAKASSSEAKAPEPALPTISPEELEAFKNDPLIKQALEIFQAEILLSPQTT